MSDDANARTRAWYAEWDRNGWGRSWSDGDCGTRDGASRKTPRTWFKDQASYVTYSLGRADEWRGSVSEQAAAWRVNAVVAMLGIFRVVGEKGEAPAGQEWERILDNLRDGRAPWEDESDLSQWKAPASLVSWRSP